MGAPHLVRRWLSFNGVGVLGLGVQLALLAVLVHGLGVHYLAATGIAVEAAVLHNFLWHQRWTWRDRPARSAREVAARLARFQALNGAISLAGNLGVMTVLTGMLRIDPMPANLAAIIVCSLVNFSASDAVVFRAARVSVPALAIALAPALSPVPLSANATATTAEPSAATLAAWQNYERQVDARYETATAQASPFFAEDAFATQPGWRQQVLSGQISMVQIGSAAPRAGEPSIPDGKVHHWAGAIFVPRAQLASAVARLRDRAGRESESFSDVTASRLLARDGDRLKIFMRLRRDSIITVSYNTEHEVVYRALGASRASSRSVATKVAELVSAGTPQEHEAAPGADRGFLWKLNAYWRFEQTADGVLIECESVSLSRGVPVLLRPFVTGAVERIARDSLARTLTSMRKDLTAAFLPTSSGSR
jgi:putative flippase GtrA